MWYNKRGNVQFLRSQKADQEIEISLRQLQNF